MRNFLLVVVVLWVAGTVSAEPLKLVSWNLEWFPGGVSATPEEAASKMYAAQTALRKINPDIVCLQEIRDWKAAAELVSALPGYSVCVTSNFDGKQQQVVASRFPADAAWAEKWVSLDKLSLPRGYAFAAIRLPGGRLLLTYSLHMKANGRGGADDVAKREASSRQLAAHVKSMEAAFAYAPFAVALGGDWNTTFDRDPRFSRETTLRTFLGAGFHSTWTGVPFEQRITHPGADGYPPITFDHVLTKGLGKLTATCPNIPGVSDHNPVVVEILPEGGSPPILTPLPTPTPSPKPAPEATPAQQEGFGFRSFTPNMNDYSEIPGMPKKPSPPTAPPDAK